MLDSEVPMGPVPCVTLRKLWDRSHVASKQTYGISPICASENTMGPVPCMSQKKLWDRSHMWSSDTYGTSPIGHMGLQNMTCSVVPMYERDIPLGYVFTSPMTYHTVIYHIECDMSRIPQHITLNTIWYITV